MSHDAHHDVYTDGGVVGRNPSTRGGTWAWVRVDRAGTRVAEACGTVTPAEVGLPSVTNNLTEFLAALLALEALPAGWAGTLYTDSLVTLRRAQQHVSGQKPSATNGIPDDLRRRMEEAKRRLGDYRVSLLGGHPNRDELRAGRRADGAPCSPHNVYCDAACQRLAASFPR